MEYNIMIQLDESFAHEDIIITIAVDYEGYKSILHYAENFNSCSYKLNMNKIDSHTVMYNFINKGNVVFVNKTLMPKDFVLECYSYALSMKQLSKNNVITLLSYLFDIVLSDADAEYRNDRFVGEICLLSNRGLKAAEAGWSNADNDKKNTGTKDIIANNDTIVHKLRDELRSEKNRNAILIDYIKLIEHTLDELKIQALLSDTDKKIKALDEELEAIRYKNSI